VVVEVGLTLVDPADDADVNVPGVMATLEAPEVDQLSVLLEPDPILVGLAVKALMTGLLTMLTVTVAVVDPEALVAVSVYVVVAVGLTLVDPLAAVDVKVPGEIDTLAAPLVTQLSVLLEPEPMLVGLAAKETMTGVADTVTVTVAVTDPAALVAVNV
jgi:hypothetical protein